MLFSLGFYSALVICAFLPYTLQQQKDPAFTEQTNKFSIACAKEVALDINYVDKVWQENHFPNDDKLKCFFKCMSLKLGVINQAGDVIDDVLKKVQAHYSDVATTAEVITECGDIQGADLCETAFKLMACIKAAELD